MLQTIRHHPIVHRIILVTFCSAILLSSACVQHRVPPPAPRVANPPAYNAPPTFTDPRWELTTLSYVYMGQGFDFSRAGLEPVVLKLVNTSGASIQVLRDEVIGIAHDGSEYLVYTMDQAGQMVYNSEYYRTSDYAAAGALGGAALGAGLGSLFGLIAGGGPAVWQGALIGGAGGAVVGGLSGAAQGQAQLNAQVRREMQYFVWKESYIPSRGSQVGYFYFPRVGLRAVRVTVRSATGAIQTYELPIAAPAV